MPRLRNDLRSPDPTLEEDRVRVNDVLDGSVVRLEDELQAAIKLVAFQRKALQAEMLDGLGHLQMGTDPKVLSKLKDLTACFTTLSASYNTMIKTEKLRQDALTPKEERAAVVAYLKSMEERDRSALIRDLVDWHNSRPGRSNSATPIKGIS